MKSSTVASLLFFALDSRALNGPPSAVTLSVSSSVYGGSGNTSAYATATSYHIPVSASFSTVVGPAPTGACEPVTTVYIIPEGPGTHVAVPTVLNSTGSPLNTTSFAAMGAPATATLVTSSIGALVTASPSLPPPDTPTPATYVTSSMGTPVTVSIVSSSIGAPVTVPLSEVATAIPTSADRSNGCGPATTYILAPVGGTISSSAFGPAPTGTDTLNGTTSGILESQETSPPNNSASLTGTRAEGVVVAAFAGLLVLALL